MLGSLGKSKSARMHFSTGQCNDFTGTHSSTDYVLITFDHPGLHATLIFLELLFQDFFSRTEQLNS